MHRSSDDGMGEDHSISHVTNHKKHKFISIQSTKGVKFFQRTKIVQKTKIIEATTSQIFISNSAMLIPKYGNSEL